MKDRRRSSESRLLLRLASARRATHSVAVAKATRALEGEVELLERLSGRKARRLDARLAAVGLARGDLGGEHGLQEALVGPGLLARPLRERPNRTGGRRRLQGAEDVRELRGLAHAGISRS
jgi:hypothetical protein